MHKVMALDVGTKRIGIALSDYLHVIATAHSTIPRKPEDDALREIIKIAKENNVHKIVVGVPVNMDGSSGFQAKDCIEFSEKIKKFNLSDDGVTFASGFDIILEDERLTSEEAEARLRKRHIDFRKNKGLVDMESACVILEQYLSRS